MWSPLAAGSCVWLALGDSVSAARALAYERVDGITWKDAYYRKDIGYRAINREKG